MFGTFKLSFDVDILAIFGFTTILATFTKIWAIFSQSPWLGCACGRALHSRANFLLLL